LNYQGGKETCKNKPLQLISGSPRGWGR